MYSFARLIMSMWHYLLKKGLYLHVLMIIALAYIASDLLIISYKSLLLPEKLPSLGKQTLKLSTFQAFYPDLEKTNFFLASGLMPEPLKKEVIEEDILDPSKATLTSLPVKLIGTIVHVNPLKSIATFDVGGQILVGREEEVVDEKFRIYFIERGKVLFLNLQKKAYEYVELKEKESIKSLGFRPRSKGPTTVLSQKEGFDFNIKRSEVNKLTADLPSLLKEATMRPRRDETGKVEGFCFSWIKGSSVFRKLGFKVKDCILGVNGESVNDPQKALKIYNELKNSSQLEISVLRDGQTNNFKYTIE